MAETEEFEQKTTATIAEAFDVMVEASGIVKRNATFLTKTTSELRKVIRPLIWVVVITAIVAATLPVQMILRDDRIESLENSVETLNQDVHTMQKAAAEARVASIEAKLAAEAAKSALDQAIANSQQAGQESAEAIERINQIYAICVEQKAC